MMIFIDLAHTRVLGLLQELDISKARFERLLDKVEQTNEAYYKQSPRHGHCHKILTTSDLMLEKQSAFRNLPPKDKQEWKHIRNLKIGDRGYVNRFLLVELEKALPVIHSEVIHPRYLSLASSNSVDVLDLSSEIDTLLLSCHIPALFSFIEQIISYKKGLYNAIRREYIGFIVNRSLHAISQFLKMHETDSDDLENALFRHRNTNVWNHMLEIIGRLCDHADQNHHDPLSVQGINNLRSIYVSLFNSTITWLREKGDVPYSVRQLLPIISDKLDFSKNQLEYDRFWNRYQEHHFLFMKLPKQEKIELMKCLSNLTPMQRVSWMGCLGKQEIKALILPMISQFNKFENIVTTCHQLIHLENDDYHFAARVWSVLQNIYFEQMKGKTSVPKTIHQYFTTKENQPAEPGQEAGVDKGREKNWDLSQIKDLSFLVVDDSEKIRNMTVKVLKDVNVQTVHQASDGLEAWEFLKQNPVDVVLCDWIMPNLSGMELAEKMMKLERLAQRTAFLMLTTVSDKASIVEALSIGVRGYLIKPFTRKQLFEKVLFATEWLRKERQSGKSFSKSN